MMTGVYVFEQIQNRLYKILASGDVSKFEEHCPKAHDLLDGELFNFLSSCWSYDPAQRPDSVQDLAEKYYELRRGGPTVAQYAD